MLINVENVAYGLPVKMGFLLLLKTQSTGLKIKNLDWWPNMSKNWEEYLINIYGIEREI